MSLISIKGVLCIDGEMLAVTLNLVITLYDVI